MNLTWATCSRVAWVWKTLFLSVDFKINNLLGIFLRKYFEKKCYWLTPVCDLDEVDGFWNSNGFLGPLCLRIKMMQMMRSSLAFSVESESWFTSVKPCVAINKWRSYRRMLFLQVSPSKRKDLAGGKQKGQGRNWSGEHRSDGISGTRIHFRRCFGASVDLQCSHFGRMNLELFGLTEVPSSLFGGIERPCGKRTY